jgi:hypothetical protein
VPSFVEMNVAELELDRDRTRGKVLSTNEEYWLPVLRMDCLEIECVMNLNVKGWANKLKKELDERSLAYIW